MLLSIREFKERVHSSMGNLVSDLQLLTGRYGEQEATAWRSSLSKVGLLFSSPRLDPFHLYFGNRGNLSLEYQLPAASSWCDIVLLGKHNKQSAAIILELKDWITRSDKPGLAEGLIEHQGAMKLHPSDQVRGYAEYCRRFHSAVYENDAAVHGCVVFTKDYFCSAYGEAPNAELIKQYPCFTLSPQDIEEVLPQYFADRLTEPDPEFAEAFEQGLYHQDRGFVCQIGKQILDPDHSPFELLDNQRLAFAMSREHVNTALFGDGGGPKKTVILIEGPPGSGKSVVAARLWASLVTDRRLPEGAVVFTSTSVSQNSNWRHLFQLAGGNAAEGVVKRATGYVPISTHQVGQLRKQYGKDFLGDASAWRDGLATLQALGESSRDGAQDGQYLVSVVDEAHALINPEHPEGRGQFGFAPTLGPLAYHIIRTSMVSIFLLDSEQGFRDRENTTSADIKDWARELGAEIIEEVSLAGAQFRCAGSKEYVDWVESILAGNEPYESRILARRWHLNGDTEGIPQGDQPPVSAVAEPDVIPYVARSREAGRLDFRIFDNPSELEAALRERISGGATARLLASYARKWKTKGKAVPHNLPDQMKDFHEPYHAGSERRYWSRIWNYVPDGNDYTYYVQARDGSKMQSDPLSEVGCPYAVRGFDFDYVGLLWFSDLAWRESRWRVDAGHVFETGIQRTRNQALKEKDPDGPAHQQLLREVAQGYRILLTRPMKGVYLWFEDAATREYVERSLDVSW